MARENQQFEDFEQWVSHRGTWLAIKNERTLDYQIPEPEDAAICFDSRGRRLLRGRDFILAKKEGTFPVYWLWPEQVGSVALYSIGSRALKYHAEVLLANLGGAQVDVDTNDINTVLGMMDRIGTPAAADALHDQMVKALFVVETRAIVSVIKNMILDVETWKTRDSHLWAGALASKLAELESKMAGVS